MIGKSAVERLAHFGVSNVNTGCVATFLVAALLLAAGLRLLTAYQSNAKLMDKAEAIAAHASSASEEDIQEQIRAAARLLNIPEALEYHAIGVARVVKAPREDGAQTGMCTIRIRYKRRISVFGIAKISLATDREIAKAFVAN